jgi:hypothetical protein
MWKIFLAFVGFALLALFVVMKGGDKLDMAGEAGGHTTESAHSAPAAPATSPATPPSSADSGAATPAASK